MSLPLFFFLYTCRLHPTNDVIMIYHVTEKVSLFQLEKKKKNQYRGTVVPSGAVASSLDWSGKD